MPRKTHRKERARGSQKPKGLKRPRRYHHGRSRDVHFAEAERRFFDAEERAA
jgi:hypothetical protein